MRRTLVASAAALAVVGVTACQPSLELTSSALPDASIAQIGLVDAITRDAPIDRPIVVGATYNGQGQPMHKAIKSRAPTPRPGSLVNSARARWKATPTPAA